MSTATTENQEKSAVDSRPVAYVLPRVNLHQDAEGYTLEAEMPGVSKSGVEVTVEDGKLTLVGRPTVSSDAARAVYRERTSSEYRRVFDLGPGIDSGKVAASIDQGLLKVRLLKSEAVKPRKIEVS